jgi:hypothetical protein
MMTFPEMVADVYQTLQDTNGDSYDPSEIALALKQTGKEIGRYAPVIEMEVFTIESRYGTATSTLASHLVDTKGQFLSTDVGKVIYNTTDKTWAVVTAYTSATDVTISSDIMISGESYEMYNKYCRNAKQINIEDVTDRLWTVRAEFPVGTSYDISEGRDLEGDVLTLPINYTPSDTSVVTADKTVYVWFAKYPKISQLTDLAATVTGAHSAGAVSVILGGLQTTGTIENGQEFTIANTRLHYRVTTDAAIASNASTVTIYPPLECALTNGTVVTFKQSSVPSRIEPQFTNYAAGKCEYNKGGKLMLQSDKALATIILAQTAIGLMTARLTQATTDIASGRTETAKLAAILDLANAEVDFINAEVDLAKGDILAARNLTAAATPSMYGAEEKYLAEANSELGAARGYGESASGYFREAQSREANSAEYRAIVASGISAASADLSKAYGYLRQAGTQIQLSSAGKALKQSGLERMALAKQDLSRMVSPRASYY